MLSKFSIRAKMTVTVSFLLISLAGSGLFAIDRMHLVDTHLVEITTKWMPGISVLSDIRSNVSLYRFNLRGFLLESDPEKRVEVIKLMDRIAEEQRNLFKTYEGVMSLPEERALYEEFKNDWNKYSTAAREAMEAVTKETDQAKARALVISKLSTLGQNMETLLKKNVTFNQSGGNSAEQSANEAYALAYRLILGILALAIILGAGAGLYLVRDIVRGISSILAPMRALANGDLTAVIPHQTEKTEIGTIADTLQVFKDALIVKKAADEAASAEADAKIARAQRVDTITREFEVMIGELVGSLSSSSTELETAANTLTSTAESTGKISGEAATASEEVSSNVQSVASATEEITSSVQEIGRQVQEASRVSGEAVKQAQKTNSTIIELTNAASRIGDVVKLISAVAEQTNLLALNATIEAARAGDAGRGFAVVASEVKALAAQTSKATDEISQQIAGIQSATGASAETIKEIGATINLISEISSTISAAVEEQGAATREISRNIQYAAERSNSLAGNINDVSRGAGETGSASNQVLSSAQMLANDSGRLKIEVEKFLTTVRAA